MDDEQPLLISFVWPEDPAAPGRALAALGDAIARPVLFRSTDGGEGTLWCSAAGCAIAPSMLETIRQRLDGEGLAAPRARALQRTLQLTGASAGADAGWRYVVETDVLAEHEVDFNAWYDTEHAPGLAAVPGTVCGARYVDRAAGASPRYLAAYDLTAAETLGSPAWLAVRGTDWSSRVRPTFRNTRRTMYRRCLPR